MLIIDIKGIKFDKERRKSEIDRRNEMHKRAAPQQNNIEVLAVTDYPIYTRYAFLHWYKKA